MRIIQVLQSVNTLWPDGGIAKKLWEQTYLDDQVMLSFVHADDELLDCCITKVRFCHRINSPFYKVTCISVFVQLERIEDGKRKIPLTARGIPWFKQDSGPWWVKKHAFQGKLHNPWISIFWRKLHHFLANTSDHHRRLFCIFKRIHGKNDGGTFYCSPYFLCFSSTS